MTNETEHKTKLAQLLTLISVSLKEELPPQMSAVYMQTLKDYDVDQLTEAVMTVGLKKWKFFPKIAEICELVEEPEDDNLKDYIENQWAVVCRAARNSFKNAGLDLPRRQKFIQKRRSR
jgi:hypothetical protein